MAKSIAPVLPSFNATAKIIVSATIKADKASGAAADTKTTAVQRYLDSLAVAGVPRQDQATIRALQVELKTCQVMLDAMAKGLMTKTDTEYVQSAMRAYWHDVPYAPSLKNNPDYNIPGADGKVKESKAGAVKTTNRKSLFATLNKALEQMRLLDEHDAAASLLDTIQEYFEEFTETEEATV